MKKTMDSDQGERGVQRGGMYKCMIIFKNVCL